MSRYTTDIAGYYRKHATVSELTEQRNITITLYDLIRRIVDIVVSMVGLVLSLPLMFIAGVLIKLDTPGPVFYVQERVGRHGKVFNMYKLRSMVVDAEKQGAKWADKDDPRVTRIGRIIRKSRIDELPQLLNVLKGDMALIGPRPERPEFILEFNEDIPGFINRLR